MFIIKQINENFLKAGPLRDINENSLNTIDKSIGPDDTCNINPLLSGSTLVRCSSHYATAIYFSSQKVAFNKRINHLSF